MRIPVFNLYVLLAALMLISVSCDDDDNDDAKPDESDFSGILENTANNVILKTYETLAQKANSLEQATKALENDPSAVNLEGARNAWVEARVPWEQSEGFLFGPVDQEGLDPSLDSWPVNVTDLNNVLNGNDSLTIAFLAQQEGTLKGFHTVEFLLWGANSNKQVSDFTSREFEYLAAASGAVAEDAQQLYDSWRSGGDNFVSNLLNAGDGSQVYVSEKAALEEIVSAMIIIADEVGNGKINDPFSQEDLTLEESRFSANSKTDFANNMRSIKHVYIGKFQTFGNGQSVSDIIDEEDSALNTQVLDEIEGAIEAIETIPGSFSDAVFNSKNAVSNAQTKVRDLQATLEEDVQPIISNL